MPAFPRHSVPRTARLALAPLALAALLSAACGGAQPAPAPAGGPAADVGPVKPKMDRVVMAVVPPASEANELRQLVQTELWQMRPMNEYLIGVDTANGKFIPQLATKWSLEPDGKSWRFTLRQGIQFHNGFGEMTGEDVRHTWRDIVQEDSQPQYAAQFRRWVEDVETPGKYEVVFKNRMPDGNFLLAASEQEAGFEIRSKASADKDGVPTMQTRPVAATGPYQFAERAQGQFLRFKRPDGQHWRATPDFPEFEFRWQKEASTRLASLLSGEVQLAGLPDDLLKQAEGRGYGIKRAPQPGLRTFMSISCCFLQNPADPNSAYRFPDSPLMDVRVRRALNKAINRDEMNKAFFAGKAEPMILNHFNASRPGWNPDWEKQFPEEYGYDPAKARALLAEAGYGPNKPLSTTVQVVEAAGISGSGDITEAIANYWKAIGVNVTLQNIDSATRSALARQYKFSNESFLQGTGSAQFTGVGFYNSGLQSPVVGVQDVEVNAVLQKLNATVETEKQEPLWRQLGDLMFKKHMNIQLFWLPAEVAYNKQIVADYGFPGSISGLWTHVHTIKAAR